VHASTSDPNNKRSRAGIIALLAIFALVLAALLALYAANLQQASGWDPRERIFGYGMYRMPGISMLPGIAPGTILFTRAGHYRRHAPERGELAIYDTRGRGAYLHRIVGMPGETIAIVDGVVTIDGQPWPEPHVLRAHVVDDYSLSMPPVEMPPDHVFMLGDNRDHSADSRMEGPVSISQLEGRVVSE
jgi:signal peptidase I